MIRFLQEHTQRWSNQRGLAVGGEHVAQAQSEGS